MDRVAPLGPVYQAGTLSGNPLAMSAGIASLELLAAPGFYESLDARAKRLGDGIAAALRETGVAATAARVGSLLTLFFSGEPIRNYADAKKCDTRRFAVFFRAMLERGIFLAPSQFEARLFPRRTPTRISTGQSPPAAKAWQRSRISFSLSGLGFLICRSKPHKLKLTLLESARRVCEFGQ